MKRVAITGSTGAIGIALIQQCIDEGINVLAICRRKSKRKNFIPRNSLVKIMEMDLEEFLECSEMPEEKYDIFYHFAWAETMGDGRNDMKAQTRNILYTLDAVKLAYFLGCNTFVGAGSQAEYGRYEGILNEKAPVFPETGYGMAKLCAGQMSRIECKKYGIKHIWTRIFSVYGPYDNSNTMISSTIKQLLDEKIPALTKGDQKWDYLYSKDAAMAMFLLGDKGIKDKIYCIGSGKEKKLIEYMMILRDSIQPELELGIGKIKYQENQVMYLCADITELQKDTGFYPNTNFEEGIKNTINWIKRGNKDAKNQYNDSVL